MAKIKIIIDGPLMDGHNVTFKAPCDCLTVEGLNVYYVKDGAQANKLFILKDSHGNNLTGLGNLFSEGAYVHVILDTINGFAYIQNAATNRYIENYFQKKIYGYDGKNGVDIFPHILAGYTVPCDGVVNVGVYVSSSEAGGVTCSVTDTNNGGRTFTLGTIVSPMGVGFEVKQTFPVYANQVFRIQEDTEGALENVQFYPYYYD